MSLVRVTNEVVRVANEVETDTASLVPSMTTMDAGTQTEEQGEKSTAS